MELKQQENLAIGSKEAISNLSQSASAKILVISDSHGSPRLVKTILYNHGKNCDGLCFCGDGMPDLVEILEEAQHDPELLEHIPSVLYFVRGNGDNSSIPLLTSERSLIQVPVETEITVAQKKIFMTHGHNYNVYYGTKDLAKSAAQRNADLAFYGHTHIANVQNKTSQGKKIVVLNPGSCSLPRGGMPHTFAIVSIEQEKITSKYYEIKWDTNGEVEFKDYEAPTGEVKLIW